MKNKKSLIGLIILMFSLLGITGIYLYWTDPLIQAPFDLNLATYAPPEIPDEENASLLIEEVMLDVLNSQGFQVLMTAEFLMNIKNYEQPKLGRLESWHRQNQFVFAKIDQALKRPHASARQRYDFSGKFYFDSEMLQNLIKYQILQKALWLRVINEAHTGKLDQAYEHVAEMFRFARFTIEEHPSGSNFMIGCALTNMASRAFNELMLLQKPKIDQQETIINEVKQFDLINKFTHSQRYSFALLAKAKHTPPPTENAVIPIVGSLLNQYSNIQLRRATQRSILSNVATVNNYPDISKDSIQQFDENYLAALFGAMAFLNLVQLSTDMIQYHEANGQYPKSLNAFTASHQDILIDPFNTKPFGYQEKEDKRFLYSIFTNLKDDQGKPSFIFDPETGACTYENLDLVWELP